MSKKALRSNYRVEVEIKSLHSRGMLRLTSDHLDNDRLDAEDLAKAIRLRVHPDEDGRGQVSVLFDTDYVCEHCGNDWTEESKIYNGDCCEKDEEHNPQPSISTTEDIEQ